MYIYVYGQLGTCGTGGGTHGTDGTGGEKVGQAGRAWLAWQVAGKPATPLLRNPLFGAVEAAGT